MASGVSTVAPTDLVADPRVVASVIKDKPPVELLREDIKVVDRFGSLEVANGLADVVEKVEPPFTISISGAWGVGKTTLAKQLKTRLDEHVPHAARVRCVDIDLWTEDIPDLRRRVALEVAVELQDHKSPKERDKALKDKALEFDNQLRKAQTNQERPKVAIPRNKSQRLLAGLLFILVAGLISFLWGFTTPSNPTVEATGAKAVVTVAAAFLIWILIQSGLVLSVVTSSSSLQPVAEKVGLRLKFKEEVTKHQDRKVLVILDNLDRLTGDTAVEALAEIRSFVEFDKSRCVFLVPLDREALERHLRRTMGGDDRSARDYLDKFFNLDVLLTKPVTSDLRAWTRDLLTGLFPDVEPSVLSPVAEYAAAAADGSPRATKRILNGVYTRAYLLPKPSAIQMDELVVVEALIARFPTCVSRLNAEPRAWVATADAVRSKTDPAERRSDLRWLLGAPRVGVKDGVIEVEDEEFSPFVNFLMLTRNVHLRPESIRAILSLRPDRQWGLLHRGDEAAISLQSGDGATLAAILEDTPIADRPETIRAAIDQIEADRKQSLPVAVVNGINALAVVIPLFEELAGTLRDVVADFLATTPPSDFRLLTPEAIEFVFAPGLVGLPRAKTILDRAIGELTPGGTPDATAVVRILAAVSSELDGTAGETARPLLATLGDPELEPLFTDVERNRGLLTRDVEAAYVSRLAEWDANDADQGKFEGAAQRLRAIREREWTADDAADRIATRATSQMASLPEAAQGSVLAIAAMLNDVGANTNIDAFALALAQAPALPVFKVGLGLASDPATLKAVATKRVTAAGLEEFRDLVETERSRLESAGVDLATVAAGRWAAGQGFEYARMTLAPGREADADALAVAAAGIEDQDVYVAVVAAVLPVLLELEAPRAASGIIADIATRVPLFKDATLGQLAPVVGGLQVLTPVDPVVSALQTAISAASAAAIAETTSLVRAFVEAKVSGAAALPAALAEHGAALGTIDLGQIAWLARQTGVKRDHVRTALVALIKTEPAATLAPTLGAVRGRLDEAWQIGKALVERAAASPDGSRDEWLVLAERWNVPPTKGQRQNRDDYAAALDTAAQDVVAQTTAARLRGKL
jgi:KAP family P-loop domain